MTQVKGPYDWEPSDGVVWDLYSAVAGLSQGDVVRVYANATYSNSATTVMGINCYAALGSAAAANPGTFYGVLEEAGAAVGAKARVRIKGIVRAYVDEVSIAGSGDIDIGSFLVHGFGLTGLGSTPTYCLVNQNQVTYTAAGGTGVVATRKIIGYALEAAGTASTADILTGTTTMIRIMLDGLNGFGTAVSTD